MIAKNNEILTSASKSLYEYNSDFLVRERCRARADYENHERVMHASLERANQTIASQKQAIAEKEQAIAKKDARIRELEAQLLQQRKV